MARITKLPQKVKKDPRMQKTLSKPKCGKEKAHKHQKGLENSWGLQKGHGTPQKSENDGIGPKNQEKYIRKWRVIYPPWTKNPFSVLTGITFEESLTIVFATVASYREGFPPRRFGLVIHDDAARANRWEGQGVPEAEVGEDINNSLNEAESIDQ